MNNNKELISREDILLLINEWLKPFIDEWFHLGGHWGTSSDAGSFCWYLAIGVGSRSRGGGSYLCDNHWEIYNEYYVNGQVNIKIYNDHIEFVEDSEFSDFSRDEMYSLYTFLNDKIFNNKEEKKVEDNIVNNETTYDFGQTLAKIEEDKREKLELFKNRMITKLKPELEEIYKSALKTIDSGIFIPVQIVYKITCNVGFDTDFILIKATDEREAWNKFWEHAADEPNLNHDDLGSKENYEHVRGSWKKRGSIVSITIEPIQPTTDFLYIGGGRNV